MNQAVKELREGLKWAKADLDPQWYGMGNAAHRAMREYPPMVRWRLNHPDPEDPGFDAKALELAATPEFERFLAAMFPSERIVSPEESAAELVGRILPGVTGNDRGTADADLACNLERAVEGFDTEERHRFADELLLRLLENIGYGKTAEAFRKLPKWYA